jgi:hypothetical protein
MTVPVLVSLRRERGRNYHGLEAMHVTEKSVIFFNLSFPKQAYYITCHM